MANVVMNFHAHLEPEELFIGWTALRCGSKKCLWSVDWDVLLGTSLVSEGGGRRAAFPFIKISSIKMCNGNIINRVALHLVFFQALPWNPKMKAGHAVLFPCYKLSNTVTGLTGPMTKELVDKWVSVPWKGYFLAGVKSHLWAPLKIRSPSQAKLLSRSPLLGQNINDGHHVQAERSPQCRLWCNEAS